MKANTFIRFARRFWIPLFLLGCIGFLALRTDDLLVSFKISAPRQPGFLVLALVFQALSWLGLALGWKQLLARRLGKQASLTATLSHLALLSLGKYVPGKVWGMIARGASLTRLGIGTESAVDVTTLEQAIVLHSAAIVSAAFCILVFPGWLGIGLGMMVALSVVYGPSIINLGLSVLSGITSRLAVPSASTLKVTIDTRTYAGLMLRYSAAWLLHGLAFVAVYLALHGMPLDASTVGLLIFANTVGMLVGFIAIFAPAGIGVREAAITGLLASHIGMGEAVVLSIAMRLWTVVTDLAFGGLAILLGRRGARPGDQDR